MNSTMIPCGSFLIGDARYPTNANILLPYPSVFAPANQWFNIIQSSTRIVVVQAFGRLKNRNNTFACMILHDILNCQGTLYVQDWDNHSSEEVVFAELPRLVPDDFPINIPVDDGQNRSMETKRDEKSQEPVP
ncbi:hypothetical protein VP01_2442g2 [Puccinia sorghi]|uniref:DDE Tnp4 domain-containing protein n=1 Tax=Puccinia sorghi TaxID=27349 RepID=A0A0L6V659_9BASI|nr:hypothetical protein VP01_2442g2 [Puccinia sorghi]